ncbi:MAG TPA: hypothetical protein VL068_12985 [Microthrixaceae bacterium]|nr:hypothetical protein [Microthrixaceae bacterium]
MMENMAAFAHQQLSRVLKADLPAGIDTLDEDDVARLVLLVEDALDTQQADIKRAEKDLLVQVPLPFRGAVKRLLR